MKREYKYYRFLPVFLIIAFALACFGPTKVNKVLAAVTQFSTEDYEDLYVDNVSSVPDSCYAGFNSKTSNIEEYTLYLEEADGTAETFQQAVSNLTGIDEPTVLCFEPTLMYYDDNKEEDVQKYNALKLYVPLPDEFQETPEKAVFYEVAKKNGKAQASVYGAGSLYQDEDEIYYVCVNLSNSTSYSNIYGFAYDENEEEDPDEDEDYEDEDPDDYGYDDPDDYGYEDPEEDDVTPTPTEVPAVPTSAPTATPVPEPTAAVPTLAPTPTSAVADNTDTVPTPTVKPTATPTVKPTATPTVKPTATPAPTGTSVTKKDSIPKTGDDFPLGAVCVVACASSLVLIAALAVYKKNK